MLRQHIEGAISLRHLQDIVGGHLVEHHFEVQQLIAVVHAGAVEEHQPPLLPGGVSEAGGGLALAQVATIRAPLIDSVRRRQAMACRLTIDPHPCFRGRRGSVRQIERPLSRGTGQQVAGQAIVPVEDAPVAIDQFEVADLGAAAAAVLRHETRPLPGILQMPAQLRGSAGMRRQIPEWRSASES